mmetsp:Transcript_3443/g.5875  ORF Transcript_3443/g.5875 Transcript_3443/m.5875 type:complete len:307 (-) Transcript_3443:1451-2371(-)
MAGLALVGSAARFLAKAALPSRLANEAAPAGEVEDDRLVLGPALPETEAAGVVAGAASPGDFLMTSRNDFFSPHTAPALGLRDSLSASAEVLSVEEASTGAAASDALAVGFSPSVCWVFSPALEVDEGAAGAAASPELGAAASPLVLVGSPEAVSHPRLGRSRPCWRCCCDCEEGALAFSVAGALAAFCLDDAEVAAGFALDRATGSDGGVLPFSCDALAGALVEAAILAGAATTSGTGALLRAATQLLTGLFSPFWLCDSSEASPWTASMAWVAGAGASVDFSFSVDAEAVFVASPSAALAACCS